jgi:hypothetical protein
MGIDGIGKKGPPAAPQPPPVPLVERGRVGATQRPFEVSTTGTAPASGAGPVERPRTALERLRTGEVDVNGYLDLKVEEATGHLGALPASHLQAIRTALRERLADDPTLVELVRAATGSIVEPHRDE